MYIVLGYAPGIMLSYSALSFACAMRQPWLISPLSTGEPSGGLPSSPAAGPEGPSGQQIEDMAATQLHEFPVRALPEGTALPTDMACKREAAKSCMRAVGHLGRGYLPM